MLSLPLVSQFPLGPSLCHGRMSRLLRPGGLRSRLLRPGGLRSRLLRPGGLRSRPPWWALVSSAPHGPGPPSPPPIPPPFHRPTGLFYMWSIWKPLFGGGGSVMNPVHELTPTHHIVSCTTLQLHISHGLHFPSTIALVTQLSPITH